MWRDRGISPGDVQRGFLANPHLHDTDIPACCPHAVTALVTKHISAWIPDRGPRTARIRTLDDGADTDLGDEVLAAHRRVKSDRVS